MKGVLLRIEGRWAHFRRPETNNNPLTHDFITKTAFIGMIGAVLGIDRGQMAQLFPQLSRDLLYGVQVCNHIRKVSWGFTMWTVGGTSKDEIKRRPKRMEFIREPQYKVAVALKGDESEQQFEDFIAAIEKSEARFTPVLGLHNCPASLPFNVVERGYFEVKNGECETLAFIALSKQKPISLAQARDFRVGVERIPTFQDNNFHNPLDKYEQVAYPMGGNKISASGEYHRFSDDSTWALI